MKADLVKVSLNYSSETDPSQTTFTSQKAQWGISERMNGGVEVEVACDQRGCEGE